jgi:hypothetical protein
MVRELWLCSSTIYVPLAPTSGSIAAPDLAVCAEQPFVGYLESLRPQIDAAVGARGAGRRLFLTREDSQHRRLENRIDVEAWFVGEGFEVHNFANYSFEEQLRLVNEADLVVGPDGSAFMAMLYARPGTRVGMLDNPYMDRHEWFVHVTRALGLKLLYAMGEIVEAGWRYRDRASYVIDVASLPSYLSALAAL